MAGFGNPEIRRKKNWLRYNLGIIAKQPIKADVRVYCYDNFDGSGLPGLPNGTVEFIHEKGIVFQYIYRYITPAFLEAGGYYFVHFLMDDCTLHPDYDLADTLQIYLDTGVDILQHSLARAEQSSHGGVMVGSTMPGTYTSFIEFFTYVMSRENYGKYYGLLNEKSCWGWGLDLILSRLGFKLYLLNRYPISHHIQNSSYRGSLPSPHKEQYETIKRLLG